jgi:hypothetical protein
MIVKAGRVGSNHVADEEFPPRIEVVGGEGRFFARS